MTEGHASLTCVAIEGHDGSGKSTLAKRLADSLHADYLHFGPPEKGSKLKDQYLKPLMNMTQPKVIDRWALGELIYGPLLRKRSDLSRFELKVLLRVFNTINSCFVLSVLPRHLIKDRLKGEQLVNYEQTMDVHLKYMDWVSFLDHHCTSFVLYEAEAEKSLDNAVLRVEKKLTENRKDYIYLGPAYGNINGKFLIVGEKVNKNRTWLDYPFTHGRASEFLAQALEAGDIPEKDCYFINADCLWLHQIAARFKDKTIISLGKVATNSLKAGGFQPIELPHPQYWLRFQYKDLIGYHDFFRQIYKEAVNAGRV